jgi:hypothetical protein
MATPEPDSEATAFLVMARRLRSGLTERDRSIEPYRERYDRSEDDLRMMPEHRVRIAGDFLRATYKADHEYEDSVSRALAEYRELMGGPRESGS